MKRLARMSKRKIRNERKKLWNIEFKEKQSNVYAAFKNTIDYDKDSECPVFKEMPKYRMFFMSVAAVEIFQKKIQIINIYRKYSGSWATIKNDQK